MSTPLINSVTLLGSSSGRNAGDAALIAGIMDSVDLACGRPLRWEIPTIRAGYIRNEYKNNTVPISMMPWALSVKMLGVPTYRSIMRTDLSLIFDAILFDRALYNPLFNFLSTLSLMLPAAKRRGKQIGYFNVGVGPVTTAPGKEMLRSLSNMVDFITVRDQSSYDILRDIGVTNPRVIVTADAALTMPVSDDARVEQILQKAGFSSSDQMLGINISKYLDSWSGTGSNMGKEQFVKLFCEGLNGALAKLQVPVLFICTQHHDVAVTKEIMARTTNTPKKGIVTNVDYNHHEIAGVLGKLQLLLGMRLHATILASSTHTPVIGLPHQPKVAHYFKSIGIEDRILSFKDFSPSALTEVLLKGWSERAQIRSTLSRTVEVARERARVAAHIVAALSAGESIDTVLGRYGKAA